MKLYGITRNTITNEFMVVFEYAEFGDLRNYLAKNFNKLIWKDKLKILLDIINALRNIHSAGFTHRDFHSGNMLIAKRNNERGESEQTVVSDLGLSQSYFGERFDKRGFWCFALYCA